MTASLVVDRTAIYAKRKAARTAQAGKNRVDIPCPAERNIFSEYEARVLYARRREAREAWEMDDNGNWIEPSK